MFSELKDTSDGFCVGNAGNEGFLIFFGVALFLFGGSLLNVTSARGTFRVRLLNGRSPETKMPAH